MAIVPNISQAKVHELKCAIVHFTAVQSGKKTAELRLNDRDYKVGDIIILKEWDGTRLPGEEYTGRELTRLISHIVGGFVGLREDYVMLSFHNEWEGAVKEACVISCIGWDDDNPIKSLADLIAIEIDMALDPAISERAVALKFQNMTQAERDVAAERAKQRIKWTDAQDDEYDPGELSSGGAAYALAAADCMFPGSQGDGDYRMKPPPMWPWSGATWKPGTNRDNLRKAAAMCIAEMDRLDRKSVDQLQSNG